MEKKNTKLYKILIIIGCIVGAIALSFGTKAIIDYANKNFKEGVNEEGPHGAEVVDCSNGQYRDGNSCIDCPAGHRCNGETKYACSPGTYQNSKRQSSCINCPAGTYQNGSGQGACKDCSTGSYCEARSTADTPCPAGYYCATPSQKAACPAGSVCPEGSSSPKKCAAGEYIENNTCKTCPVGNYCNGVTKTMCSKGTYQSSTGQTSCIECGTGKYQDSQGAISCKTCNGTVDAAHTTCTVPPTCSAGEYIENNTCKTCPVGNYCNGVTKTMCSKGTYQNSTGKTSCIECEAGKYQDSQGALSCKTCDGTVDAAHTTCTPTTPTNTITLTCITPIDVGAIGACTAKVNGNISTDFEYKSSNTGVATINSAGKATGVSAGTTTITATYKGAGGGSATASLAVKDSSTITCAAGEYIENGACKTCPVGNYCNGVTKTMCSKGTYQNSTGQTSCIECEYGKYQDSQGALSCKTCNGTVDAAHTTCTPTTSTNTITLTCITPINIGAIGACTAKVNGNISTDFEYESSNTGVATINSAGKATGVSAGTTTITATYKGAGGGSATASLAVKDSSTITCAAGEYIENGACKTCPVGNYCNGVTKTMCSKGTYQNSTGQTSCIECEYGKYQDSQGALSCKTCNGTVDAAHTTCTSTTNKTLTSISASPSSISLNKGQSQYINVIAKYSDGSSKSVSNVSFSGMNGVVTNPAQGYIYGSAAGTTTLTISYTENNVTKTDTCSVVVTDDGDDNRYCLEAGKYIETANSSGPICGTCPSGYYCPVNESNRKLCPDGKTSPAGSDDESDCTSNNPITSFTISPSSMTLEVGSSRKIIGTVKYQDGTSKQVENIRFSGLSGYVTNPAQGYLMGASVVDSHGVTVSYTEDGVTKTAVCTIKVVEKGTGVKSPVSLDVTTTSTSVYEQETIRVTSATVTYQDGTSNDVTSKVTLNGTSNITNTAQNIFFAQPNVINWDSVSTTNSYGEKYISDTVVVKYTENGETISKSINVNIIKRDTSSEENVASLLLKVNGAVTSSKTVTSGTSFGIEVYPVYTDGTTGSTNIARKCKWMTSDSGVASVSGGGVSTHTVGFSTIIASYSGKASSLKVTVLSDKSPASIAFDHDMIHLAKDGDSMDVVAKVLNADGVELSGITLAVSGNSYTTVSAPTASGTSYKLTTKSKSTGDVTDTIKVCVKGTSTCASYQARIYCTKWTKVNKKTTFNSVYSLAQAHVTNTCYHNDPISSTCTAVKDSSGKVTGYECSSYYNRCCGSVGSGGSGSSGGNTGGGTGGPSENPGTGGGVPPAPTYACYRDDNNNYQWAITAPSGYTLVSSIVTADNCRIQDAAACYKNSAGDYVWGNYQGNSAYSIISDIKTADKCSRPAACYKDYNGKFVWGQYSNNPSYTIVNGIDKASKCNNTVDVPSTAANTSVIVGVAIAIMAVVGGSVVYFVYNKKKFNLK